MNGAIEDGPAAPALQQLFEFGLQWTDNYETGQVFALIGFDVPDQRLAFYQLGKLVADWLSCADLDRVVRAAREPQVLRSVTEESGPPITRAVLH
ncbi:hypothetical protein [Cupriavidus lacunae]|uniref:hypothetical protein n=1 Tax=Cupriavidus lacunae TaxID=2666307 RepID=UPI000E115086|nr:hypothetical protein [Cupriavidus lacunae]